MGGTGLRRTSRCVLLATMVSTGCFRLGLDTPAGPPLDGDLADADADADAEPDADADSDSVSDADSNSDSGSDGAFGPAVPVNVANDTCDNPAVVDVSHLPVRLELDFTDAVGDYSTCFGGSVDLVARLDNRGPELRIRCVGGDDTVYLITDATDPSCPADTRSLSRLGCDTGTTMVNGGVGQYLVFCRSTSLFVGPTATVELALRE